MYFFIKCHKEKNSDNAPWTKTTSLHSFPYFSYFSYSINSLSSPTFHRHDYCPSNRTGQSKIICPARCNFNKPLSPYANPSPNGPPLSLPFGGPSKPLPEVHGRPWGPVGDADASGAGLWWRARDVTWRENSSTIGPSMKNARTTQDRSSSSSLERPGDGSDDISDINTYESPIPEQFPHLFAPEFHISYACLPNKASSRAPGGN